MEPTRAVHYISGGSTLRSGHKASTIAARLGSSVTDNQATSFFIPKRDTHAPLVGLFCPLCLSEPSIDPAIELLGLCKRLRGLVTSCDEFGLRPSERDLHSPNIGQ